MTMYSEKDHTFIICAYKESPFLEECIKSILGQTARGHVMMTTSTPNEFIYNLGRKYGICVLVNRGQMGIAEDWNFAYEKCSTALLTLAHQDDIYAKDYLEILLDNINKSKKPLIAFTNYGELRNGVLVNSNVLLKIKRIMLFPLKFKKIWTNIFIRRKILSLGSPICCPSVLFVKTNLEAPVFHSGMKSNIDWEAWEKISKYRGSFVYCSEKLMYHRIHDNSTTTEIVNEGQRRREDLEMFCKFWPKWFALIWEKIYQLSERSNRIKEKEKNR